MKVCIYENKTIAAMSLLLKQRPSFESETEKTEMVNSTGSY
jgi:hypothetical protein